MIRSMTGFGRADRSAYGYKLHVDLKSVNHRYCEISVRIPREWAVLEDTVRRVVQKTVKRGRLDAYVVIERETDAPVTVEVNWTLVEAYRQAAVQLQSKLGFTDSLSLRDMLQLPDVIAFREADADTANLLEQPLEECVAEAVANLVAMREAEGVHLARDFAERLNLLERLHEQIRSAAPLVVEEYRSRLLQRLNELVRDQAIAPDDPRIAMEVALLAERSNIEEELTRLSSHFAQFRKLLKSDEPVGRKLDFLIQEMNREANTIGSKANSAEIASRVVDMKAELEKVREQAQNVE